MVVHDDLCEDLVCQLALFGSAGHLAAEFFTLANSDVWESPRVEPNAHCLPRASQNKYTGISLLGVGVVPHGEMGVVPQADLGVVVALVDGVF